MLASACGDDLRWSRYPHDTTASVSRRDGRAYLRHPLLISRSAAFLSSGFKRGEMLVVGQARVAGPEAALEVLAVRVEQASPCG